MKKLLFTYIVIVALCSCRDNVSNDIVIKGNVPEIPDGKIYLTEAHYWQTFLDSTDVKKGKFTFNINPDSSFYPYLASLYFLDSNNKETKVGGLSYTNTKGNAFYLEKGTTTITANPGKSFRMPNGGLIVQSKVKAGKQNIAFTENASGDFGWLQNTESSKRVKQIEYFKKQITKYSYSFYLLESILNARGQYSKQELENLLSLFDPEVVKSVLGEKIRTYISLRKDESAPFQNFSFLNVDNKKVNVFDAGSKLNVLVFWASWCGPCRAEIPELKKIYESYKTSNINMVSISTDENPSNWRKALLSENMPWKQLIIDGSQKQIVDAQFDPSTIPLVIITDNARRPLKKFVGFEEEKKNVLDSVLRELLAH